MFSSSIDVQFEAVCVQLQSSFCMVGFLCGIFLIYFHIYPPNCLHLCLLMCIICLSVQVAELHWQAPMNTVCVHVSVCDDTKLLK